MSDGVLLTGISGFLGGHVALALLKAGYAVRGSLRDLNRADHVRATLSAAGADPARVEFVSLNLNADGGWPEAMAGCRYLVHTASPFVTRMPRHAADLVRPAVDGTRRAITAALATGIDRVVLTSSMAAIIYGHGTARNRFTAADWTDLDGPHVTAYAQSKTRAEQLAWALMDKAGRHDDLAVINPALLFGPLLDDDPGTSATIILNLLDGRWPAVARVGIVSADVRDAADLHVAALTAPAAAGQRLPLSAGTLTLLEVADILRRHYPQRRLPRQEVPDWLIRLFGRFHPDMASNIAELGVIRHLDAAPALAVLGRPVIDPEAAILATARTLIERGLVARKP